MGYWSLFGGLLEPMKGNLEPLGGFYSGGAMGAYREAIGAFGGMLGFGGPPVEPDP